MTTTKVLSPSYFPNIDIKPLSDTSVVITEIREQTPLEFDPQGIPPAVEEQPQNQPAFLDFDLKVEHFRLSFEILNVLERYGRHINVQALSCKLPENATSPYSIGIGKHKFLPHVFDYVQQTQPIQLTMPAFPCKSLNRVNKVLGYLPDLGEELALSRLHAMGEDIKKVYTPGAEVNIASDGVLFNDILGISDEDCWDYGEALRAIIFEKGLTSLKFTRCMSLLDLVSEKDINKKTYLATTDICRQKLEEQYGPSEDAITKLIKKDKDTSMTYCGMVIFLQSEMETSPALVGLGSSAKIRVYKKVAKKMMQRSEAFTLAIRTLKPQHVRLSMHPSSGATKLSIPLIPTQTGDFQRSPWHSCVAVGLDEGYRCVHSEDVRETHDLIYQNGRPYFYRARIGNATEGEKQNLE